MRVLLICISSEQQAGDNKIQIKIILHSKSNKTKKKYWILSGAKDLIVSQ